MLIKRALRALAPKPPYLARFLAMLLDDLRPTLDLKHANMQAVQADVSRMVSILDDSRRLN